MDKSFLKSYNSFLMDRVSFFHCLEHCYSGLRIFLGKGGNCIANSCDVVITSRCRKISWRPLLPPDLKSFSFIRHGVWFLAPGGHNQRWSAVSASSQPKLQVGRSPYPYSGKMGQKNLLWSPSPNWRWKVHHVSPIQLALELQKHPLTNKNVQTTRTFWFKMRKKTP